MNLSKWIDGKKFKPAHVGVWEVDIAFAPDFGKNYQFFNGRFMGAVSYSKKQAKISKNVKSMYQDINFRGLAEKP